MPLVLLKHLPYINEYFIGLSLLSDSLKNHCSGGNFTLPPRNGTVLAISLTDTFMAVIWLKDQTVKEIWNHIILNFSVLLLAETWLEFCVHQNYCRFRTDLSTWGCQYPISGVYSIADFHEKIIFRRYLLSIAYPWRWYLSDFWSILLKERKREGNEDIYLVFY